MPADVRYIRFPIQKRNIPVNPFLRFVVPRRRELVAKPQRDGQVGQRFPTIIHVIGMVRSAELGKRLRYASAGIAHISQHEIGESIAGPDRRGRVLRRRTDEVELTLPKRVRTGVPALASDLTSETEGVLAARQINVIHPLERSGIPNCATGCSTETA